MQGLPRQAAPTVEAHELDQEREGVHVAAELRDEVPSPSPCRRSRADRRRSARAAPAHGVVVNLERVGAVLEVVALAHGRRRQLARLAHRREAGAEAIGHRRPEDEPAALDADDDVDALAD